MNAKEALEWLESVPLNDYTLDCLRIVREERTDLLDVCEHYAECGDGCTCGDGWSHDVARDAIAKYEGEN